MEGSKPAFNVEEASIGEINAALESGKVTSRELVLQYMKRIADFDKGGPKINSVLEINPDAVHIAEAMDHERAVRGARGPLHGIPVLIKDNINTKDKMHTSAGSLALKDSYAPFDAFLVNRLRQAGAVILGKTNMTEFANFMTDNMPSGYSSRGGQVMDPYGPFTPGGSSSGSGAAAACSFCAVAVGTETSGSILSPSSQNSIVGIKPTLGLISRTGIIPIAHSQDTAGPMARTVEDAAILLGCLTGIDNEDPATLTSEGRVPRDYTRFLNIDGLKGARIGVPREYFCDEFNEDQKAMIEDAIDIIKGRGGIIVNPADISRTAIMETYKVLIYEFKSDLNAYLSTLADNVPVSSLKDIIEFNSKDPDRMLKYGQTILIESEGTSGTLTEPEYILEKLRDVRLSQDEGIDEVMDRLGLDALLFGSTAGCDIAARAGYPSITVPMGYTREGEPFGITFTAKAYSEPRLIELAYAFEQASKKRVPPKLI